MISGIHHVQISVDHGDEEKAKEFYSELFGFKELKRPESLNSIKSFWLQVGPNQLHVRSEENSSRESSSDHVAYQVDNLKEFKEKVLSYGLEIKESIKIPGMERFEFRDPFGNRIEILELKNQESQ